MKNIKLKSIIISLSILLSSGGITPISAHAETTSSIATSIEIDAKIGFAGLVNCWGAYQEALALIYTLPKEQQENYTNYIANPFSKLFTTQIMGFIDNTNAVAANPDLQKYTDLIARIDASTMNEYDKGYFKGQMTIWGHDRVYTPDVQAAIVAIEKVWTDKTQASVDAAKAAIAKKGISAGSVTYLNTQLQTAIESISIQK